ncbi:MAG: ABC transporter substrate-binding protein [Thermodesulfobacteriota bacterium]
MKRIIELLMVIAFITTALFLGCAKKESEVIKIGVIAPLTGDAATYGVDLKKGMDLAVEEINTYGGVKGKKIELIYEDSKADPKTAVSAMNKLISIDKVKIVLGDMFSATTLAMAPIAERSKVVLLSPTASAEAVPNAGDYIFTIFPSDVYEGKILASFIMNKYKGEDIGIIYPQADVMATIREEFKATVEKLGGKIVFEESYIRGISDFRSMLTKMKRSKAEIVFLPTYLDDMAKILRESKELGIDLQFVTISTALDERLFKLAGNAAENLIFSAPFYDPNSDLPMIREFVHSFEKKYGQVPNIWAAYGYDVVNIAALALDNSTKNHTEIKEKLLKIKDYPGVTGKTSFKENGGVEKSLNIMTVKDQKFVKLQ